MNKKIALCVLALAGLLCAPARADEASVRQAFQAKFPQMTVESVNRTPFAGIYEVVLEGQTLYTDEKLSYLFSGNLLDIRGREPRNLTQEATGKRAAATLAKSTEFAFKRVRGNGKRVLYTFEDPNCAYCKKLHEELKRVNDVTVYTFLWPILSPDSVEKSKGIWCAKDRSKAWDEVMAKGVAPAKRDCDTPFDKNAQLAQRFGIRGTPGVFIVNGQQIGGYVEADKLEAALAAPR